MKKTRMYIFLFLLVQGVIFIDADAQSLTKVWTSSNDLRTPESVCFFPAEQALFVANINGNPTEKDNNGFISIVDLNGEIKQLKWVDGLNAPKGMGIYGGKLYVTDIDEVVEIDIADAKILKRYPVSGAMFLNDIDVDEQGNVYISDSQTNKIHKLTDGEISTLVTLDVEGTNGVYYDDNALLVGVSGKILAVDLATKKVTEYISDTGGGVDGLEKVGDKKYVISDWQGKTHLIAPGKDRVLLLDTTDEEVNAADLEYVPEKKWVIIPTFFNNRIAVYKIDF